MPQLVRIVATLWLLVQLAAAIPNSHELVPVPRHIWDTDAVKRSETDAIGLSDHEKFVWASTDKPNSKAVVVSMVAYSKQDERILDMDKFGFALEEANCAAGSTYIKFKHDLIYHAAKIAWEWVNYNDMRAFVLVPSWKGCGEHRSHDPLVVKKVTFDDKTKKITLESTQSTWKKVMNTFVLDFGEVVLGGDGKKRDIIPDLDKKFRLDVGATLPQELFGWELNEGALNASLTANCNECGTQGTLVFAGHMEASLGWGGIDVDKFEISVTPEDVQAGVNLSLDFEGQLDFRKLTGQRPSAEITLLEIPVSGWNIPKIFEFGPRIQLNAGYGIDYIGGMASASAGIVAKIPNDAIAKLDLLADDSVQVSGWMPEIETQPLEIEAQVDAQADLYTEIALSVSLTVLEDNGFGVDLAFKLPEVTVTAVGGYKSDGFCEEGGEPWGVDIGASVGVNLGIEVWKELDGDKDPLYEATLFEKPDLFEFPVFCMGADSVSQEYCPAEPNLDEDPDNEGESTPEKRALVALNALTKRQEESDRKPMYADCTPAGGSKRKPITVLKYNSPETLKDIKEVPIFKPAVSCAPDTRRKCKPDTRMHKITSNHRQRAAVQNAITRDNASKDVKRTWASEHIYEGNWIRDYINHLQSKTDDPATCDADIFKAFFETQPQGVTPPPNADQPNTYMKAVLQNLGTIYTEKTRMAIIPMKQNNMKKNMFMGNHLVGYFTSGKDTQGTANNAERRACDLARISTTCKFLNDDFVVKAMRETVKGIEDVLDAMDKHVPHPKFKYKTEHQTFFKKLFNDGVENARDRMQKYAEWMTKNDAAGFARLTKTSQAEIKRIAGLKKSSGHDTAWEKFCPSYDW